MSASRKKQGCAVVVLAVLAAVLTPIMVAVFMWAPTPTDVGIAGPSEQARADIPPDWLAWYEDAGRRYGLDWSVVAAFGKHTCDHGRSDVNGCKPGTLAAQGSRGPMLFTGTQWSAQAADAEPVNLTPAAEGTEKTAGWATDCDADSKADPRTPHDAICAVARYMNAHGAPANYPQAIIAFTGSDAFSAKVVATAAEYRAPVDLATYAPEGGWPLPSTQGRISYFGSTDECQSMALWQKWGNQGSCRLDADPSLRWYIAMRWADPPDSYPWLREQRILITIPRTGKSVVVVPGDWGPHIRTGRDFDVSLPTMRALGANTDDTATARWVHPSTPTGPATGKLPAYDTSPGTGSGGDIPLASVPIPWCRTQKSCGSIKVHTSIGPNLSALLAVANRDGIKLGGWGYRSYQRQVELRSEPGRGCGDGPPLNHYDIYEAPSSSCSPPTAPPGRSQHERGLAIDFTCNSLGNTVQRGTSCDRWLKANAPRFGLHNLPSEAWHYSSTGR